MTAEERTQRIVAEIRRVDGIAREDGAATAKHRRMAENPYRFMRGTAQLYYADLASGEVTLPLPFVDTARQTAVTGDCHMANFGFVTEKGSHGQHIFFGPTDFDEACIGRAGWDLLRYIVSLYLAQDLADGVLDQRYASEEVDATDGLATVSSDGVRAGAQAFLDGYVETCLEVADMPSVRRETLDHFPKGHPLRRFRKKAAKRAIGGKKFASKSSLGKAVEIVGSGLRFRDCDRYRRLDAATEASVRAAFRAYVDDDILDVVQRLGQGTGSLDMRRYYLLVGPTGAATGAELPMCQVVEVKQQRTAAAVRAFPDFDPRNSIGAAHLTVNVQRRVQREPDLLLDQVEWNDACWLIRSRHHARVGIEPEDIFLTDDDAQARVEAYARACGRVLALAHARGDNRSARFEASITAAIRQDGSALIESGAMYAERTIADWRLFAARLAG